MNQTYHDSNYDKIAMNEEDDEDDEKYKEKRRVQLLSQHLLGQSFSFLVK